MAEVIAGMQSLERELRALEYSQQRKALIDAAKAGAEIVVAAEKAAAPRRSGRLAAGIKARVSAKESDLFEATVDVGADQKQFYGYFYNLGTGRYFDREKARELGRPGLGGHGKKGHDQPGHEFFIRTFESVQERASEAMKAKMLEAVYRIAR